jgi:hypothetical protein
MVAGTGKGTTYHPLPGVSTETPLLREFSLEYIYGDNHIKKITIMPNRVTADSEIFDTLRLTLADKRPRWRRDKYGYYAEYYIGPLFGAELHETGPLMYPAEPATGELSARPTPASVFALVGFSFEFHCPDDHHLSRITLREQDGSLFLALQGGHSGLIRGCNTYDANVLYTWLHPLDVFDSGTVSGTGPGGAEQTITTHGGQVVVGGFDFHLTNTEFGTHLKAFGVGMGTSGIFTRIWPFFYDKQVNQPFTWTVDWVEVGSRYFPPPSPPPLSPDLLLDRDAARQNAEEWMKRQERRMAQ